MWALSNTNSPRTLLLISALGYPARGRRAWGSTVPHAYRDVCGGRNGDGVVVEGQRFYHARSCALLLHTHREFDYSLSLSPSRGATVVSSIRACGKVLKEVCRCEREVVDVAGRCRRLSAGCPRTRGDPSGSGGNGCTLQPLNTLWPTPWELSSDP